MRDLEDEKRIKEYMTAKMTHIKMYNECMNLADGLDVEKFAELVRADERAKREWVGLTKEEVHEVVSKKWWDWEDAFDIEGFSSAIEAKLKEKNT